MRSQSTFLAELRKAIHPYHDRLEQTFLLSKLSHPEISDDFDQNCFCKILQKFYGFYAPLEEELFPKVIRQYPQLSIFFKPKLGELDHDLGYLCKIESKQIPRCENLPTLSSSHEWLGLFYVLEGSNHGRQYLWPKLAKKLSLHQEASLFFSNASQNLREHWSTFCTKMEEQIQSPEEARELIHGATQTFEKLTEWFEQ